LAGYDAFKRRGEKKIHSRIAMEMVAKIKVFDAIFLSPLVEAAEAN
jgi:hypothetical protein